MYSKSSERKVQLTYGVFPDQRLVFKIYKFISITYLKYLSTEIELREPIERKTA